MPMTLIDHLKASQIKVADFAALIHEPENTIRKIVYGQRQPSLPLAVKISEATNGAVPIAALVLPEKAV